MQLVTAASLLHEVKLQQLHTQVDEQLGVIGGQVILNPNANILKVVKSSLLKGFQLLPDLW